MDPPENINDEISNSHGGPGSSTYDLVEEMYENIN